jgi:hypothetical protein
MNIRKDINNNNNNNKNNNISYLEKFDDLLKFLVICKLKEKDLFNKDNNINCDNISQANELFNLELFNLKGIKYIN